MGGGGGEESSRACLCVAVQALLIFAGHFCELLNYYRFIESHRSCPKATWISMIVLKVSAFSSVKEPVSGYFAVVSLEGGQGCHPAVPRPQQAPFR